MNQKRNYVILFGILAAILFIPLLGGVHLFDWDEINFAEIAREMIVTKDYLTVQIDFQPFWEKPPLFIWMQVVAMKLFGVNEFAARFPNAICGIITIPLLFNLGKRLYNVQFGVLWASVYLCSILPSLYFRSGIIDPWFNLFIFLGLYFFILAYWKKDNFQGIELRHSVWRYLFWAGIFTGLGILTKGQVAYLLVVLPLGVYWIFQRFRFYVQVKHFLFFTLFSVLVAMIWFGLEIMQHGTWFINEFVEYQIRLLSTEDSGHGGFPGYHFVVILVGCFPASIFAIRAFFKMPTSKIAYQQDFKLWMSILFWVVLILFSVVQSKIVHYSSLTYFPLTFLAALVIQKIIKQEIPLNKWMKNGLIAVGSLYIIATIAAPILAKNIDSILPYIQNTFAQENLKADIYWSGWEAICGVWLALVIGLFLYHAKKSAFTKAFQWLLGGTAVFVVATLIFFAGRVEGYAQLAAIEFFESKVEEDCYIMVHGYKTYAPYFYAQKKPLANPNAYDRHWLSHQPLDKDLYIVLKIDKIEDMKNIPDAVEIGRKNGFVFFKRNAN